jgi:protein OS-9
MTTTDSIFFIKETKTCQYTLVIHTPRLCGQPGFKSPREDLQDTPLRCRKVVGTLDGTDPTLPESPLPFQRREPKPLPAPRNDKASTGGGKKATQGGDSKDPRLHLIKVALEALSRLPEPGTENGAADGEVQPGSGGTPAAAEGADGGGKNKEQRFVAVTMDENGEIRIDKLLGNNGNLAKDDEGDVMEIELAGGEFVARLIKTLREVEYDARLPGQEESEDDAPLKSHDEL